MRTKCPHCQTLFKVPDTTTGKRAKCSKCSKPFVIAPVSETANAKVKSHETETFQYGRYLSKGFYLVSFLGGAILSIAVLCIADIVMTEDSVQAGGLKFLGVALLLYVVGVSCLLYYNMWAAIQDEKASISPLKAVGFLVIPLFNVYWSLYMFVGYAEEYNAFIENHSIDAKPLPKVGFAAYAISWCLVHYTPFVSASLWVLAAAGERLIEAEEAVLPLLAISLLVFSLLFLVLHISFIIRVCNAVNSLRTQKPG